MATTETRTGFRLPWSQDHTGTDEPTGDTGETVGASESSATAAEGAAQETERPDMIDATPGVLGDTPQTAETDAPAAGVTADAVAGLFGIGRIIPEIAGFGPERFTPAGTL